METIFSIIRQEIQDFTDSYIEIVPGYNFSQYETVKRCHLYDNGRFEDASLYNSREKFFYNISNYRRMVAGKMLNFNTGDVRLLPLNENSPIKAFLLQQELKVWLKKNGISHLFNQVADELPLYGSCVIRKNKKGASLVDLRRLFNDPTVEKLKDSRFITIKHYLTESQLRAKAKDGWENIDALIERRKLEQRQSDAPQSYEKDGQLNQVKSSPYYIVYERFGEIEESYLTGRAKDKEFFRSLFIVADIEKQNKDGADEGFVLFKSEWKKDYPFTDLHYYKVRGRWLGLGVTEMLFTPQERVNELANQKRIAMEISSMHLFQTKGKTAFSNILNELENGQVIYTGMNGEITPVVNEERNLPAFGAEEQRYDSLADRMTFTFDAVRGETLPATTPATNAVLQNQNANSIFAFRKEILGEHYRDFFNQHVLPELIEDLSPEHVFLFTGSTDELQKLDSLIIEELVNKELSERFLSGEMVEESNKQAIQQSIERELKKRGSERFIKAKKDYYKDAEVEFDFMVTNEQENIATIAQNLFQLLTVITQNPGALQNPVAKKLLYEWSEKIGINPSKLEVAEQNAIPMETMSAPQLMSENQKEIQPINQLAQTGNV